LSLRFDSEAGLSAAAAAAAGAWQRAGLTRLLVGLAGDLGVGKTTFVRALLRGLGYRGRVPSPTYTLLEQYELGELSVIHLDLYRLAEPRELDFLGLRDCLALPAVWVLAEWPERGGSLAAALDLSLELAIGPEEQRSLRVQPLTAVGRQACELWLGPDFK
jgi:tRNA threonylcarbamoyladenosine biosynthesis protein TsaE